MSGQNQENSVFIASLDADWLKLIMKARELGLSKEIVKAFLTGKRPETVALKEQH
jgi:hypothetical protein